MDIQTKKTSLVKHLLDKNDESLIQQIKDVFEHNEKDFWNDLPENVKAGIERSRKQAESGVLTPHDEVMKKYAK
ncbi:MAG: hypothetical protein ABI367_09545 [Mucilaginibacter sp.]